MDLLLISSTHEAVDQESNGSSQQKVSYDLAPCRLFLLWSLSGESLHASTERTHGAPRRALTTLFLLLLFAFGHVGSLHGCMRWGKPPKKIPISMTKVEVDVKGQCPEERVRMGVWWEEGLRKEA